MHVPLLDLKPQYAAIRDEVHAALAEVLDSQRFILGPVVERFERRAADYLGAPHAVGCANGSDALALALMALDVGAGDEVLTTPFTFIATGGAIARLGAVPRFIDIDPVTYNIDPGALRKHLETYALPDPAGKVVRHRISSRPIKAILPVHLYGQAADMGPILETAGRFNLPVVEDAAQAFGALHQGKRAGTLGTLGTYSFFPSKNLGAWGDAGLVVTPRADLAEKLRMLRVHGSAERYVHPILGINSRLDALQAAVLEVKLRHLDSWTAARQARAARYDALLTERGLTDLLGLPARRSDRTHIFHQYVLRCSDRDAVRKSLKERGIETEVYYPIPMHLQGCFAHLGHRPGSFPESERAAREVLALPMYPELPEEAQAAVADALAACVAHSR